MALTPVASHKIYNSQQQLLPSSATTNSDQCSERFGSSTKFASTHQHYRPQSPSSFQKKPVRCLSASTKRQRRNLKIMNSQTHNDPFDNTNINLQHNQLESFGINCHVHDFQKQVFQVIRRIDRTVKRRNRNASICQPQNLELVEMNIPIPNVDFGQMQNSQSSTAPLASDQEQIMVQQEQLKQQQPQVVITQEDILIQSREQCMSDILSHLEKNKLSNSTLMQYARTDASRNTNVIAQSTNNLLNFKEPQSFGIGAMSISQNSNQFQTDLSTQRLTQDKNNQIRSRGCVFSPQNVTQNSQSLADASRQNLTRVISSQQLGSTSNDSVLQSPTTVDLQSDPMNLDQPFSVARTQKPKELSTIKDDLVQIEDFNESKISHARQKAENQQHRREVRLLQMRINLAQDRVDSVDRSISDYQKTAEKQTQMYWLRSEAAVMMSKIKTKLYTDRMKQLDNLYAYSRERCSSPVAKNAKQIAEKLFTENSDLVERSLLETEQYATKKVDFKLKTKKLLLTQRAVRDFIVGIFNKNIEDQLQEVEKAIAQHQHKSGYKKIQFDLVNEIDNHHGGLPKKMHSESRSKSCTVSVGGASPRHKQMSRNATSLAMARSVSIAGKNGSQHGKRSTPLQDKLELTRMPHSCVEHIHGRLNMNNLEMSYDTPRNPQKGREYKFTLMDHKIDKTMLQVARREENILDKIKDDIEKLKKDQVKLKYELQLAQD